LLPEEATLFHPSLSLCLELVAKIYYRHLMKLDNAIGTGRNMEWESKFDIDRYLRKKYIAVMPYYPVLNGSSECIYKQKHHPSYVGEPTEEHVHKFIGRIILSKCIYCLVRIINTTA